MKIIPPRGCIFAAYFESELIFTIAKNLNVTGILENVICQNTSFEFVEIEEEDFEEYSEQLYINFRARYEIHDEPENCVLHLKAITFY
jgi:hypothetical protein